jgi:hypothetical protein
MAEMSGFKHTLLSPGRGDVGRAPRQPGALTQFIVAAMIGLGCRERTMSVDPSQSIIRTTVLPATAATALEAPGSTAGWFVTLPPFPASPAWTDAPFTEARLLRSDVPIRSTVFSYLVLTAVGNKFVQDPFEIASLVVARDAVAAAHVAEIGSGKWRVSIGTRFEPTQHGPTLSWVRSPVVSRDARTFAYAGGTGTQAFVMVDNKPAATFDGVRDLTFHPDGRLAFVATRGRESFLVDGDQEHRDWPDFRSPAFSSAGKLAVLVVDAPNRLRVLFDGRVGPAVDTIAQLHRTGADGPFEFSPDGQRCAYIAKSKGKWSAVIDDQFGPGFDAIGKLVFSSDSRRVAYSARSGKKWYVVTGDEKSVALQDVAELLYRPDGEYAYAARSAGLYRLVDAGVAGPAFEKIANVVFSQDSKRVAYAARQHGRWTAVIDGRVGSQFTKVDDIVFDPTGSHVAFRATQGKKERVVADGQLGPEYDSVTAPVFHPTDHTVMYVARDGGDAFVIAGPRTIGPFRLIPLSHIIFSADARSIGFLALSDGDHELWWKVVQL